MSIHFYPYSISIHVHPYSMSIHFHPFMKSMGKSLDVRILRVNTVELKKKQQQKKQKHYHYDPKYWDRESTANSGDPDQMLQNAGSEQGLHCLALIQHYSRHISR